MNPGKHETGILSFLNKTSAERIKLFRKLVRTPTVNPYSGDEKSSGEAEGQLIIAETAARAGGKTRTVPVPRDIYKRAGILGPQNRSWKNRKNLVAQFHIGTGKGPVFVLNSHIDTVGVSGFEGKPFSGKLANGIVYGRGASDCKSGTVAAFYTVRALMESGAPLNCRILWESVVDEECNGSGAGTLACCLAGMRGDYCIVMDGPSNMLYTGCQGIVTVEITVRGKAGHASTGGVNAVDKIMLVKKALDIFSLQRAKACPGHKVNIGLLQAGSAPWTVPNHAKIAANIAYSRAEALQARRKRGTFNGILVREKFERILKTITRADPWLSKNPPCTTWMKDVPPFAPADSGKPEESEKLFDTAAQSYLSIWKKHPESGTMPAWSDASHLARIGLMPVVGMGAGEPGTSHTSTEYNRVANITNTAATAALTILRLTCTSHKM